jgi:hypothetical protein
MLKLITAIGCISMCCATLAQAQEDFRAGLSLRAGFGGRPDQEWRPHVMASFGSGPEFLQQGHIAEGHCLMTAGDMRINGASSSTSACESAPLLELDLHQEGLGSANLLGLNLMRASSLFTGHSSLLSGNSEWVQWTLHRHALGADFDAARMPMPLALPSAK